MRHRNAPGPFDVETSGRGPFDAEHRALAVADVHVRERRATAHGHRRALRRHRHGHVEVRPCPEPHRHWQVALVRRQVDGPRGHARVGAERSQPDAPRDLDLLPPVSASGETHLQRTWIPAGAGHGRRESRDGRTDRRRDRLAAPLTVPFLHQDLSDIDPEHRRRPGAAPRSGRGCRRLRIRRRAEEPRDREVARRAALDDGAGLANRKAPDPEPVRPVQLKPRGLDALGLEGAVEPSDTPAFLSTIIPLDSRRQPDAERFGSGGPPPRPP